jgi:predicted secreted protein with PEFG-CTERM motif
MKIQTKIVFPLMIVFVTTIMLSVTPAFADNANVSVPQGTSVPGCETTNECFIPYEVTVNVGDEVTWSNDDSAAHTVTGGSATDGPSGVFDSSLFMAATTFSHTFEAEGEFPYFCMVHPWMMGIVTVQAAGAVPMLADTMELDQIMAEFQTSDGVENNSMTIDLTLTDLDGNGIEHITYNIKATQGSDVLLDEEGHMHQGILSNTHTTDALSADASESMPVVITIESVGFGHDEQYIAVTGEIATKQVVPEFGTIAAMILAVAIISIIAMSAKSKLSIMPRL